VKDEHVRTVMNITVITVIGARCTYVSTVFDITRVYPKVSGPAAWSENCKWYGFVPLDAVVSLFRESV
jgi:hypothetical protein